MSSEIQSEIAKKPILRGVHATKTEIMHHTMVSIESVEKIKNIALPVILGER